MEERKSAPMRLGRVGGGIIIGSLRVQEHSIFSEDTVGQAKILGGDTQVHVTFDLPYQFQPIVTLTLRGESALSTSTIFKYTIVDETTEGFTIKINQELEEDILFNWHAFGSGDGKLFVSDNTVEDIEIMVPQEEPPAESPPSEEPPAEEPPAETPPAEEPPEESPPAE